MIFQMLISIMAVTMFGGMLLVAGKLRPSIGLPLQYTLMLAAVLLSLFFGGTFFTYLDRPEREDTQYSLYPGVEYIRDARDEPRPLMVHIITIDMDTPGLEFLVTPGTPTGEYVQSARRTSEFLDEFGLQIAINADSFSPWYSNFIFDRYPNSGDGVNPRGLTASQGDVYTQGYDRRATTVYFSEDNQIDFAQTDAPIYNAVSGYDMIVVDGVNVAVDLRRGPPEQHSPHPRTAYGFDYDENTLILMVVDGRQPDYSEGVTTPELAQIMLDYGADVAINMDGGGSSTLVVENANGEPEILNSPVDVLIPGTERYIATHLGVYVGQ